MPKERHLELARRLLVIQDRLQQPITIPHRPIFTDEDVDNLVAVETILDTGCLDLDSLHIDLATDSSSSEERRRRFIDVTREFSASLSDVERPLLDTTVHLGEATLETCVSGMWLTMSKPPWMLLRTVQRYL